jgi:hypothetical protein
MGRVLAREWVRDYFGRPIAKAWKRRWARRSRRRSVTAFRSVATYPLRCSRSAWASGQAPDAETVVRIARALFM